MKLPQKLAYLIETGLILKFLQNMVFTSICASFSGGTFITTVTNFAAQSVGSHFTTVFYPFWM